MRINRFSPYFIVLSLRRAGVRLRLIEIVGGAIEKYALIGAARGAREGERAAGDLGGGPTRRLGPLGLPRLSGNVLLWEQEGLTLRLEGRFTKEQAIDLARSVR